MLRYTSYSRARPSAYACTAHTEIGPAAPASHTQQTLMPHRMDVALGEFIHTCTHLIIYGTEEAKHVGGREHAHMCA